nr:hypothetical protein [uncultured Cohaesibacter sp.]
MLLHFPRMQLLLAAAISLFFASSSYAASFLKAEEGYLYYCVGQKFDGLREPNAIVILKLRKEDVSYKKKSRPVCFSESVDEHFVMERFFGRDDDKIGGFVSFRVPITISSRTFKVRMIAGAGLTYLNRGILADFERAKQACGVFEKPNAFGLLEVLRSDQMPCNMMPFDAFVFPDPAQQQNIRIYCFSKTGGKCAFDEQFRQWSFRVYDIPRGFLPQWREIHEQLQAALKERIVFYLAPDACEGGLDCKRLSRYLYSKPNDPQN